MAPQQHYRLNPALPLKEQVDDALAYFQYSDRTRNAYKRWIQEYATFTGDWDLPDDRVEKEMAFFLHHLETDRGLSPSSRHQAMNAIVFLYKKVLGIDLALGNEPVKVHRDQALPVVLTQAETKTLLAYLKHRNFLMAGLMYGAGLRLMECIRLRVHHLDFKRNRIYVYPVNKGKLREVMIPETIKGSLMAQISRIRKIHDQDLSSGNGGVDLPQGLVRKYHKARKEFVWQYVFPAKRTRFDDQIDMIIRSHVGESGIQKAVKTAAGKAGINKKVSCMTLRHSFALHLLENGVDIYTVKMLMGHSDVNQTRVYLKLMADKTVESPLDKFSLKKGT